MSEARAVASELPEAPPRLVGDDGLPRFGLYAGSLADASMSPDRSLTTNVLPSRILTTPSVIPPT